MGLFYKYMAIEDNGNTISALSKGYIFCSKPSQFNDPFDCYINISLNGSEDDFKRTYEKYSGNKFNTNSGENGLLRMYKSPFFRAQFVQDFRDKNLVYSLSKKPDNLIMWSHYAKNHTGICLIFQSEDIDQKSYLKLLKYQFKSQNEIRESTRQPAIEYSRGIHELRQVEYSKKMPDKINILNDKIPRNAILNSLYTKYDKWRYEDEYRIVIPRSCINEDNQKLKYKRNIIKGVIFGMKSSPKDREDIIKIMEEKYKGGSQNYYLADMKDDDYGMNINQVTKKELRKS